MPLEYPTPIDPAVFGFDPFGFKQPGDDDRDTPVPQLAQEAHAQAQEGRARQPEESFVPPRVTPENLGQQEMQQIPPQVMAQQVAPMQQPLETPQNAQIPQGAFPATLGQQGPPPQVTPQQMQGPPPQGPPPPVTAQQMGGQVPQLPGPPAPGATTWDAPNPVQQAQQALSAQANPANRPSAWRQVLGALTAVTPLRGLAPLVAQGPAGLARQQALPAQLEAATLYRQQQQDANAQLKTADEAYKTQTNNIETKLHGELMADPSEPLEQGWMRVPVKNPTTKQTEYYRVPSSAVQNAAKLQQKKDELAQKQQPATAAEADSPAGKAMGLVAGAPLDITTRNELIRANMELAKPAAVKVGDEPLGPERIAQINQAFTARYQVLHPNTPLPAHYVLAQNSTSKDFDRTDKLVEGEEKAFGTKENRDQTNELRKQTQAIAAQVREQKTDVAQKQAGLKAYTPAVDSAERFNVMAKNYEDAVGDNDQQAMLSLLANHLGMTMGLQKGSRLTRDIIREAQQSRPWLQGLAAKFDKDGYLSGVTLTPKQMLQMVSLGRERFAEDLTKAHSEANYLGVTDGGPKRTPNKSTMRFYLKESGRDPAKAKQLAASDGWSVE